MALTTCPDCGGAVSDAAPACIHCGRPMTAPAAAPPAYAVPAAASGMGRVDDKAARAASAKTIAILGYALQVLAFAYFLPGIAGLLLAYIKRGDARGTWVESHFDWQIATFWSGLWWVLGTLVLGLGAMLVTESPELGLLVVYGMAAGVTLWYIYRIVRGALALNDERPIG